MIIWSGIGLIVFVVFVGFYFLIGTLFAKGPDENFLQLALACLFSALAMILFSWRTEKNLKKADESEALLADPLPMDPEEKKKAELYVKMRTSSLMFKKSTFFFVSLRWWPHILSVLTVLFLILYFIRNQ